jgi:DNA-binding XRE family transcriptional regulator
MTDQIPDTILPLDEGTTATNVGVRGPLQRAAVAVFSGALALCFFGTSSISALPPKAAPQAIACGSTHSSMLYAQGYSRRAVTSANAQVRELHRRSGLTWEQIAQIFGVDRRTIHLWASGKPMRAVQAEKLGRVMSVLARLDRSSPTRTRDYLLTASVSGKLILDLMQEGRFDEIASASVTEAPVNRWTRMRRPPRLSESVARQRREMSLREMFGGEDEEPEIG